MKKQKRFSKILITLLLAMVMNVVDSQPLIEDFSVTDVNGVEHNLYEILDDGKIVFIYAFTTYCSPCWDFHSSMVFENMWQEFGPNGTDEIFLMSIEVGPSTAESQLFNSFFGNWTENISYPIANADIHGVLGGSGVFAICPNRSIHNIMSSSITDSPNPQIVKQIQNCIYEPLEVDVAILESYIPFSVNVCPNGMYFQPEVTIQNVGTGLVSDLVMEVVFNEEIIATLNFSEEIPQFETRKIFLPEVFLQNPITSNGIEHNEVSIQITNVNGNESGDENNDNNLVEQFLMVTNQPFMVDHHLGTESFNISISTGNNGHELYWAIVNDSQEIIAEGGNIEEVGLDGGGKNIATSDFGYKSDTSYTELITLPEEGCYEFIFVDDGNIAQDGFLYYRLMTLDFSQTLAERNAVSSLSYDRKQIEYSTLTTSIIEEKVDLSKQLTLIPNPLYTDELVIHSEYDLGRIYSIQVLNINGKVVEAIPNPQLINNDIKMNLSNIQNGMYFIRIETEHRVLIEKVILSF